jgi:transcriptional repressor NrdR
MQCPYCEEQKTKVVDSRTTGNQVRRRRECRECEKRFTTYESPETLDITVKKRDGSEEPFSISKIKQGVERAVKHTAADNETTPEEVAHEVKKQLSRKEKIESEKIGETVMQSLKKRDEVAYLRFASVYEQFESAESFKRKAQKLED